MKKNGSYVHVYIYVKSLDVNYRRISKNDIFSYTIWLEYM